MDGKRWARFAKLFSEKQKSLLEDGGLDGSRVQPRLQRPARRPRQDVERRPRLLLMFISEKVQIHVGKCVLLRERCEMELDGRAARLWDVEKKERGRRDHPAPS